MRTYIYLILFLLIISCDDDDSKSPQTVDELIRSVEDINTSVVEKNDLIEEKDSTSTESDGKMYNIKRKTYELAKNLDNDFVAFNTNIGNLWPGAIVQGKDVSNGILTSIGDDISRTNVEITLSSGDQNFGNFSLESPKFSNYLENLDNTLKNNQSTSTANIKYKYIQSYSVEQSLIGMGIGFLVRFWF